MREVGSKMDDERAKLLQDSTAPTLRSNALIDIVRKLVPFIQSDREAIIKSVAIFYEVKLDS